MENGIGATKSVLDKYIFYEKDRFPPLGRLIRRLMPQARCFIAVKRRPLMIICETVNICNNDCIICAHSQMTRKKEIMPLDLFEKVLHDYSDMGGGKLSLTPMIGDIFLDNLLVERIRLASRYPKVTGLSITTNAIASDILTDRDLALLLETFERVHVSVYGLDEEEYSTMTRRPHFLRMRKNVKRMIALSRHPDRLRLGFRFLKDHTEDEVRTWILESFGTAIHFNYTKAYCNWGNRMDTSRRLPFSGEWIPARENATECLIPFFACQVFSNGDVSYCACPDFDIDEDLKLGNIRAGSLAEIYNSDKGRRLWGRDRMMPAFCKHCTFSRPISDLPHCERFIENPIAFIGG
jgi:MoaA/NifB/PqqE/SkfB family radical SAM enzyme